MEPAPAEDWLVDGLFCWVGFRWIEQQVPAAAPMDEYLEGLEVSVVTSGTARYLPVEDFVILATVWLDDESPRLQQLLAAAWNSSCAFQDRYKLETLQDFVADLRQIPDLTSAATMHKARAEMLNRNELKGVFPRKSRVNNLPARSEASRLCRKAWVRQMQMQSVHSLELDAAPKREPATGSRELVVFRPVEQEPASRELVVFRPVEQEPAAQEPTALRPVVDPQAQPQSRSQTQLTLSPPSTVAPRPPQQWAVEFALVSPCSSLRPAPPFAPPDSTEHAQGSMSARGEMDGWRDVLEADVAALSLRGLFERAAGVRANHQLVSILRPRRSTTYVKSPCFRCPAAGCLESFQRPAMAQHLRDRHPSTDVIFRVCRRNLLTSRLLIFTLDYYWSGAAGMYLRSTSAQMPPGSEGASLPDLHGARQLRLRRPADTALGRAECKRPREEVADLLSVARQYGCDMTLEADGSVRFHSAST